MAFHSATSKQCLYSACSLDLGSFGLGCLQKDMENRMRKIITSLIAILVVTNLEAQQRTPKLVVCITVDQLRGDYIEYFYNTFGERGFKRLMNEGLVYNNIRFEFSDIDEASAFATLFTGSNPNFNGIAGKNIYDFDKEKEVSVLYDPDYRQLYERALFSPETDQLHNRRRTENRFQRQK